MGWENPIALLLCTLALLLVSAGIEDVRTRQIANGKNLAIALLAPFWWWANGIGLWSAAAQIGIALTIFGIFCIAFARGWMGGGDVKLIGALALWFVDLNALVGMLIVMSLVGGVLTIVLMIEQKCRKNSGEIEIPYGVAIAIAALFAIREPIINHFT